MAKKGQVQLQTEVTNDEEWEKLLQRDGLIVVDIYSEWCGPCSGMQPALKKIKLEIGGDMLQLAIAKSDDITDLQRFKYKSEPTWMFISHKKMINLMFGANSPKLSRMIIEELKKEEAYTSHGQKRITELEPSEYAHEELERKSTVDAIKNEAARLEDEKRAKELYEARSECCKSLLNALNMFGVVLIMPHCKTEAPAILQELYDEEGYKVRETIKIKVAEEILEELQFFSDFKIPEDSINHLLSDICLVQLIKPQEEVPNIERTLLRVLYGESGMPPGDPESPAYKLIKTVTAVYENEGAEGEEEVEEEEEVELIGVWTPPNAFTKAMALKFFFPKHSDQYVPPPPEPEPPYIAICYDAFKRHDLLPLMEQYPKAVMRYGFFTSDIPEEATLIAKSNHAYEKRKIVETDYAGRMVFQLSKKSSESVLAFASLTPTHMSANIQEGVRECKIFFPEDYDEPEPEEEEVVEVKSKKKKKGKKPKPKVEEPEDVDVEEEAVPEQLEEEEDVDDEEEEFDEGEEEEDANIENVVAFGEPLSEITKNMDPAEVSQVPEPTEADKATSPVEDAEAPPAATAS